MYQGTFQRSLTFMNLSYLSELLIPDKANVFYAINNSGDLKFVLRTKKEQDLLSHNRKRNRRKLKLT